MDDLGVPLFQETTFLALVLGYILEVLMGYVAGTCYINGSIAQGKIAMNKQRAAQ